jgi:hypothetical protein
LRNPEDKTERDLGGAFRAMLRRLQALNRRFRPGHSYKWKTDHYTKTPMAARKAKRRRQNKAARAARRNNRRRKK